MSDNANTIYRIFYTSRQGGEWLAYIGRTRQNLTQRLRNHFFGHPMQRKLDVDRVSRIEYTTYATVADMYIAEIILINQYKPPLNVDDRAPDEMTLPLELPPISWQLWDKPHLTEKWMREIKARDMRCVGRIV
jgi:hypothetical protein